MTKQQQPETVAVVGLGYVGLPLALLADRKGYRVIGVDTSEERVAAVNRKVAPFEDVAIAAGLAASRLEATTDFARVREAEMIAICVPTPVDEQHMPDLEPVRSACRGIAPHLAPGALVVLESTVNPGVSEEVAIPELERVSGLTAGKDFYFAHCPERVDPGNTTWNVENIPRVVGASEPNGLARALAFYRSIITAEVKPMGSLKEAEAVKIVENSFRDVNIAFVNELAKSFAGLGIDVVRVIEGAATKPFGFMPFYPGSGVGGHCIPVDPYYLIEYAKGKNGFSHEFLSLARAINNSMPVFAVDQLADLLNTQKRAVSGTRVAVLGLAYKADIDDLRESPALTIIAELKRRGAEVVTYDPHVPAKSTAKSLDEALASATAAIIATAHQEFRALRPEDFSGRGVSVVVDGRNCLPKDEFVKAGVLYRGIGR